MIEIPTDMWKDEVFICLMERPTEHLGQSLGLGQSAWSRVPGPEDLGQRAGARRPGPQGLGLGLRAF